MNLVPQLPASPSRSNHAPYLGPAILPCLVAVALGASSCAAPPPVTHITASAPSSSRPGPTPASPPATLAAAYAALPGGLPARSGISVAPVGSTAPVQATITTWGGVRTAPAWSAIKIPLTIASGEGNREATRRALQQSDNDAAATLWTSLGGGSEAARRVQDELRAGGDATTTVQYGDVRPPYTPYGQTVWSLPDSVAYAATLPCRPAAAAAYADMRGVVPQQRWGLGTVAAEAFKGGWGPRDENHYLARQVGILRVGGGRRVAVSLVTVVSGGYEAATADLGLLARFVADHLAELPAGSC